MARVAPDRRWFGNTRTIGQEALKTFREEMGAKYKDPYSVIIKQSKLPLSLLEVPKNEEGSIRKEMDWDKTFGDKAQRKRVRMESSTMDVLASNAAEKGAEYANGKQDKDRDLKREGDVTRDDRTKNSVLLSKGQSNRIWTELYKVIDSSDVVLYIVDARDPMGTRSAFLEDYMRREKKYKHFVLILNKCDLVPLWATARWLQILSKDYPTIAFHASVNHPFGKGNLISLLRQFSKLHNVTHRGSKRTKTPISVGIIGYPNVGKSSLINTLRRKTVCKVAPIPGETKVWQYVALTKSIFLIDCPGIVYDRESNNDVQAILKGVVRVERLGNADKTDAVNTVLQIVKEKDVVATYGVTKWADVNDFLEQLAKLRGKLVAGGLPDVEAAARMVLYDWQRGRLPWFNAPSFETNKHYRDAIDLPEEKQMKLIDHYNNFNVVDETIVRNEEDVELSDDEEKGENDKKQPRRKEGDKGNSQRRGNCRDVHERKEEEEKKLKRQQKKKAKKAVVESEQFTKADAEHETTDELWNKFFEKATA
ncbi:nuclear GTP-binding protein [Angomonas deanei]|nr:nuclear GTP-binding protein [Angomonas deanei]|eukprot:EPY38022.1 nuclear GTP-binding protein [Angomonas deanei]